MLMKCLALSASFAVCASSFGGIWTEVGDAGELLPGQATLGSGSLDQIFGHLTLGDVDLYRIEVVDFANFRASTVNAGTSGGFDTSLFLFDANGFGISYCEDAPGSIQSTITNQFLTGNGTYYLAMTSFTNMPASAGGSIWAGTPWNEKAPDGPGAAGALTNWGTNFYHQGDYQIDLQGTTYSPVPEPATITTLAGLALAGAMRRRRSKAAA